MKSIDLRLYALGSCVVVVAALAGCGNATQSSQTLPLGTSSAHLTTVGHWSRSVRHASVTETVLHSFGGPGDGREPDAGLTYFKGTFYGTTNSSAATQRGCGTVFSITPAGKERVLYSFVCGSDGAFPEADLINVNGTFYGTTDIGGSEDAGTVFSITRSGTETVLYSFRSPPDGAFPGGLLNVKGTIYGTTGSGGAGPREGRGIVFTITPSGNETVIYTFRSYLHHGGHPAGPLFKLERKLYGTTRVGGLSKLTRREKVGCCGTVFALNPSDHETLLYIFKGSPNDGAYPNGGLVDVNGTLYGTTLGGGVAGCLSNLGCGTVFSITPSGTETMLHAFTSKPDGSMPSGRLLNVNGTMYGTTQYGGTYGRGTVYSITPSGTETVLYSFKGSPDDGATPGSDLTYVNGRLYGTTEYGGKFCKPASYCLGGTVFSIAL